MLRGVLRAVIVIIGAALGYYILPSFYDLLPFNVPAIFDNTVAHIIIFGFIFYFIATFSEDYILDALYRLELYLKGLSLSYLTFGLLGMIAGLILAWLINMNLIALQIPVVSNIIPVLITIVFVYLGYRIGTGRREEIENLIKNRLKSSDKKDVRLAEKENVYPYKVLDTSVIIDGRIKDVMETGFLEGEFVVTQYVLQELQHIADSSDSLKREKGRRGLDILNDLQHNDRFKLEMYQDDDHEEMEVDQRLVLLAKKLGGALVTNDYNLNKVAGFQNVPVLNINDLANSVKPVVIVGEEMQVQVVKPGTERQQGVGYLEDGTMVIVEEGQHYMDEWLDVVVTSTIQTSAGRMIFTEPTKEWLNKRGH